MDCPNCHFTCSPEFEFCPKCGFALSQVCPQCAFEAPADFSFCPKCGTQLGSPAAEPETATEPMADALAERPSGRPSISAAPVSAFFGDVSVKPNRSAAGDNGTREQANKN